MKFNFKYLILILGVLTLSGCLASGVTPVGIVCDSKTQSGPVWTWPLVCQPNGG